MPAPLSVAVAPGRAGKTGTKSGMGAKVEGRR